MEPYKTLFAAFKGLYSKLNASGFVREHEQIQGGYCYLSQLSNSLDWKNSCGSRFERSIYQFTAYASKESKVTEILDEIQHNVTWNKFQLQNPRKLCLLEFLNRSTGTSEPEVYYGRLAYTCIVEKSLNTISQVTANSIKGGINQLYNLPVPFVINDYNRELELLQNGPYCRIPGLNTSEGWLTSKSRIENTNLNFEVFSPSLGRLLDVLDLIETKYDYAKIIMPNTHMIFEWESNSIEELEPEVWFGSINYSLLNEIEIT